MTSSSRVEQIKKKLDHPVVDADCHVIEFTPVFLDYLKDVGGPDIAERFAKRQVNWYKLSAQERIDKQRTRTPWWALPTANTLDRATAMLPRLLNSRLDEMGIDFAIAYPTLGLIFPGDPAEDVRRACCRALNTYHAELFSSYSSRMTPVAVIPLTTPEEGIEELEYAVNVLGFKAIMTPSLINRPITEVARIAPKASPYATWIDTLAFESAYDYDPFWAKCRELKVAVTVHSGGSGWGTRNSVNNYMFNHIGNFAAAGEGLSRSLIMGGVTRRFPDLKFAFLEGGVGWATALYAGLVGHWQKRNRRELRKYDPTALDHQKLTELFAEYGQDITSRKVTEVDFTQDFLTKNLEDPDMLDEFSACGFESVEDIRDQFQPNFYFGCEADDPQTALAFDRRLNPLQVTLKAIFGSDIGHWDVPDMSTVLAESYELVENGLLSEEDFRAFTFTNAVTLHGGMNPDFYKGTVVADEAETVLVKGS
ncbi:MAG: amidohydrolase family protein [Candidatus Lindowbacteria bacterium]|nr:amidohydrolase family protein [Candidatus Lindowbacteria bacterium]